MEPFSPVGYISVHVDVSQADLEGIHSQPFGQLIHMLLTCPGPLGNAIASKGPRNRFIGVDCIAVNFDIRYAVWTGGRQATPDANGSAFFPIGAGSPENFHLSSHQLPVIHDPTFNVNNGLMTREC